ncbi:glycerol-3-phosphate dehydrogenase [Pedomonas sp. V897]|uniref:glycerol-3-phosphate dehydrogenase n=1 Tax=Pedomonas sp. V897 TaxID=3446482 RepID=UPI003EDFA5D8
MTDLIDLFIVGGGINGAAVARDAVGRGLSVFLAEQGDYASATSSASSKLIHGGLRYLEQREFRLVRESLRERDVMLRIAPHLVEPIRFLVPVTRRQRRPGWVVRLGLWLYDRLASSAVMPPSGRLDPADFAATGLRTDALTAILHYSDCQVDDARLTLSTLLDARARGATIRNYCKVAAITPVAEGYRITCIDEDGRDFVVSARAVVNAAGPWADPVLRLLPGYETATPRIRLVRGSHIVVPMPEGASQDAFTLLNDDRRVVFVLPWLGGRYRVIGTTDVDHPGAPDTPVCTPAERDYLLAAYNRFFAQSLEAGDIIWSWSGVRALVDDGTSNPSAVSREYRLEAIRHGTGMFLSVLGGKLTSHRPLAEAVMRHLRPVFSDLGPDWTATAPLTGGALPRPALERLWQEGPTAVPGKVRRRWTGTYGAEVRAIFSLWESDRTAREQIAPGVYAAELMHAVAHEDVRRAEDFLYRRTRLFLELDTQEQAAIADWLAVRRRCDAGAFAPIGQNG